MPDTEIELQLPAEPEAAAMARRALAILEGRVSEERLEELELLVSELVTNSIRHAGLGEEGSVSLRVRVSPRLARVEVTDAGEGFEPPSFSGDPALLDGWGLLLVERLTDRWGVRGRSPTCVWFELDLDG
jgi:anti-sigma regulatory factor (Ser/Thr protein kinase)